MKEKMRKIMKNEKGFTLIEMIVVMAIIGVLAAILIPSMSGFISNSKDSQAVANGRTFQTAATAALTNLAAQNKPIPTSPITTASADATDFKAELDKLVDTTKFTSWNLVVQDGAINSVGSWVEVKVNGGSDRKYWFQTTSLSTPTP